MTGSKRGTKMNKRKEKRTQSLSAACAQGPEAKRKKLSEVQDQGPEAKQSSDIVQKESQVTTLSQVAVNTTSEVRLQPGVSTPSVFLQSKCSSIPNTQTTAGACAGGSNSHRLLTQETVPVLDSPFIEQTNLKETKDGKGLGNILLYNKTAQKRQLKKVRSHDIATGDLKKTSVTEDKALLDVIETADPGRALELLKGHQTFSQNALDNALISACRCGYKFLVQTLVRFGANVQTKDADGNTPLMICVAKGFIDIVRFLISKQTDINAANSVGDTALILSIRPSGSMEMIKLLLEQKKIVVKHQNKAGYTALMKAVEVMDIDAVKLLLETDYKYEYIKGILVDVVLDDLVNCRTAKETAERRGLGTIFEILKECRNGTKSPLMRAIDTLDLESFHILLDIQFLDADERKNFLSEAFQNIFTMHTQRGDKTFTQSEMIMIKKLLENGAGTEYSRHNGSSLLSVCVDAGNYTLVQTLCEHGIKPDQYSRYNTDRYPLNLAATHGRCDLVELLLKYGAKINCNKFSRSTLDCALIHGHTDCAELLIEKGANIDIKDALISAVHSQNPEYMKFLLQNYRFQMQNILSEKNLKNKLLVQSAERGNLEIVSQILDAGADINQPNTSGVTALAKSKNGEVAHFLIQKGADVNHVIESEYGRVTALVYIFSSRESYLSKIKSYHEKDTCTREVIQVLVEYGARVSERDRHGRTPLMLAALVEGSESLLQMLLDHGADFAEKDNEGNMALLHAVIEGCTQNASFLIQFTKERSDFLNVQNNKGSTALSCAVSKGRFGIAQELIDQGADVNIKDVDGNTALLCAVKNCSAEIKHLLANLVHAGSDVNYQNNDGLSPLMLAARSGIKEIVSELLDLGADVNAVSLKNNTKTAISFVMNSNKDTISCLELLLDRDADSSYLDADTLHKLIRWGHTEIIPKLIRRGLGPADVIYSDLSFRFSLPARKYMGSPLHAALTARNMALARYFVDNLFLTSSDVTFLMCNKDTRYPLALASCQSNQDFIDEMSSQPMSLFSLAFISVTSSLGAGPGREDRVNLLPLPQKIKDKLLFKTEEVSLGFTAEKTQLARSPGDFRDRVIYALSTIHQGDHSFYVVSDGDDDNYYVHYDSSDSDYYYDSDDE